MPAITTVSLVPDKYIKTSTIIERPAKFLLIGGITKAMEASAAIERIDTSATRAETQIEFMDMNGESVEIEGLSNDSAIVAAHGLLYATQIKLINQRNAGHKFSE